MHAKLYTLCTKHRSCPLHVNRVFTEETYTVQFNHICPYTATSEHRRKATAHQNKTPILKKQRMHTNTCLLGLGALSVATLALCLALVTKATPAALATLAALATFTSLVSALLLLLLVLLHIVCLLVVPSKDSQGKFDITHNNLASLAHKLLCLVLLLQSDSAGAGASLVVDPLNTVILEELLDGTEFSLLALFDSEGEHTVGEGLDFISLLFGLLVSLLVSRLFLLAANSIGVLLLILHVSVGSGDSECLVVVGKALLNGSSNSLLALKLDIQSTLKSVCLEVFAHGNRCRLQLLEELLTVFECPFNRKTLHVDGAVKLIIVFRHGLSTADFGFILAQLQETVLRLLKCFRNNLGISSQLLEAVESKEALKGNPASFILGDLLLQEFVTDKIAVAEVVLHLTNDFSCKICHLVVFKYLVPMYSALI
eukprot:Colp12_sorted_trinity150504_noHs@28739